MARIVREPIYHFVEAALLKDDVDALRARGLDAAGLVKLEFLEGDGVLRVELNGMGKACQVGAVRVVAWLVDQGQDIENGGSDDLTALHCACEGGQVELAKWLVSHGADVNAYSGAGPCPLHFACYTGDLELLQLLVPAGAEVDFRYCNFLHSACWGKSLEVLQYLVSAGADVNERGGRGRTPIYCVSRWGCLKALQLLMSAGSALDARDEDGMTPLQVFCDYSTVDAVKYLVSEGASVNSSDYDGITPLHCASWQGNLEMVQCLVSHGADVNATTHGEGWELPVNMAAVNKNGHIVKWLLMDSGVPHSPAYLEPAAGAGNMDAIQLLMPLSGQHAHTAGWAACLSQLTRHKGAKHAVGALQAVPAWSQAALDGVQGAMEQATEDGPVYDVLGQKLRGELDIEQAVAAVRSWVKWRVGRGVAVLHRARMRGEKQGGSSSS